MQPNTTLSPWSRSSSSASGFRSVYGLTLLFMYDCKAWLYFSVCLIIIIQFHCNVFKFHAFLMGNILFSSILLSELLNETFPSFRQPTVGWKLHCKILAYGIAYMYTVQKSVTVVTSVAILSELAWLGRLRRAAWFKHPTCPVFRWTARNQ